MTGLPIKRSVTLAGHRTSISLEAEFWDALQDIAKSQNSSVNGLISRIDAARTTSPKTAIPLGQGFGGQGGLSSAVRRYVLAWYRDRAR
ncbi:MAG: ribbon-helix-helix domain-containing protein [Pseudomonadota bacterium]